MGTTRSDWLGFARVNIALDLADLASCPSFDGNSDDKVVVNELIRAVRNALIGCD